MTEWTALSREAAFESHRLIGWIFWDPTGIAAYEALGVPNGAGYYVATRAAPLGDAGNDVVAATFYSINAAFIALALDLCRQHTTFADAAAARDAAVVAGLRDTAPEICDELAAMSDPLWRVVDGLAPSGRVLFAAHRQWPRPDDPLLSSWLALNCLREWRGDTHWGLHVAEGIDGEMAGILDNAWRSYEQDWIPRSRGANDEDLAAAYERLEDRGFAAGGRVTDEGIRFRHELEHRLDRLTIPCWQPLGEDRVARFVEMVSSVGDRFMARVDATAGENWMPAARVRPTADDASSVGQTES